MRVLPKSKSGKWAIGFTMIFLLLLIIFFIFMLFGVVTFDKGHWWDATVGIAVPVEIIAFILSIITLRKRKDKSVLIYLSTALGICLILFLLLHSLFIND